jgi:hypothetical protein
MLWLCALAMAGCTVVPLRSLWALRKIDPMTLDPAELRAAVRLPEALAWQRDAVAVDLSLQRAGSTETQTRRVWLRPVPAAGQAWPGAQRPGSEWALLALDEPDQRRVLELRVIAAAWKAAAQASSDQHRFTLLVQPKACRRNGAQAGAASTVSAWLRWAQEPGWVELIDDEPLASLLPPNTPPIPACAG